MPANSLQIHHKSKSLPKLKGAAESNSYIDGIVQAKLKIPLVGKYDLVETIEEQQKKWEKYGQRKFKPT